jgi:hypothetical protein
MINYGTLHFSDGIFSVSQSDARNEVSCTSSRYFDDDEFDSQSQPKKNLLSIIIPKTKIKDLYKKRSSQNCEKFIINMV